MHIAPYAAKTAAGIKNHSHSFAADSTRSPKTIGHNKLPKIIGRRIARQISSSCSSV